MVGIRQVATCRQPLEQTGAACRNRAWMIASPRMAAAPDDRLVINAIPAQVWRADPDGRIQFVNDVWLDYTGLSVDETLGWAWTTGDVIHPDDLPGLLETWRRVLASGQPDEAETRVRRSDGEYRWFLIRAVPVRSDGGVIVGWCGTNTDIEDRKRAEALLTGENQLLERLSQGDELESIPCGALLRGEGDFTESS